VRRGFPGFGIRGQGILDFGFWISDSYSGSVYWRALAFPFFPGVPKSKSQNPKCTRNPLARRRSLAVLFGISAFLLLSVCLAGPFDQLGETTLATVSPDCTKITDYDISPLANSVLYYGTLKDGVTGVWLPKARNSEQSALRTPNSSPHSVRPWVLCDEVYEYGFTRSGKAWLVYRVKDLQYVAFDAIRSSGFTEIINDTLIGSRIVTSEDGNHIAFRVRDGVWQRAVRDLKLGPEFTNVTELTFDSSGRNLYYLAQQGNGWLLVTNGKPGKPYESASNLILAPRTGQPTYLARDRGRLMLVVGAHEGRLWTQISEIAFTPGDSLPAYIASDGGTWKIVEDTTVRLSLPVALLHSLQYRTDTREPVFVAIDAALSAQLMVGTHPASDLHSSVDHVSVSPDGKRITYLAQDSSGARLFVNRTAVPFSGKLLSSVRFSPDSRHYAYVVADDATEGLRVFLDDRGSPAYTEVRDLQFESATSHLAYTARGANACFVVVDTMPGPEYDGIGYVEFVPGTAKIAYLAVKGDSACQVIAGHSDKFYEDVGSRQFSPDRKRVAYGAKQGNTFYWVCSEVPRQ
jgi:hypothetical protein